MLGESLENCAFWGGGLAESPVLCSRMSGVGRGSLPQLLGGSVGMFAQHEVADGPPGAATRGEVVPAVW